MYTPLVAAVAIGIAVLVGYTVGAFAALWFGKKLLAFWHELTSRRNQQPEPDPDCSCRWTDEEDQAAIAELMAAAANVSRNPFVRIVLPIERRNALDSALKQAEALFSDVMVANDDEQGPEERRGPDVTHVIVDEVAAG